MGMVIVWEASFRWEDKRIGGVRGLIVTLYQKIAHARQIDRQRIFQISPILLKRPARAGEPRPSLSEI